MGGEFQTEQPMQMPGPGVRESSEGDRSSYREGTTGTTWWSGPAKHGDEKESLLGVPCRLSIQTYKKEQGMVPPWGRGVRRISFLDGPAEMPLAPCGKNKSAMKQK